MRIGFGYDLHVLTEGRDLMLGGVKIPSRTGEVAHSDGDVLIHAIIDSLFGALSMDDIGAHFPPSDMKYKDMSSVILLKETMRLTEARVINLDCTVILEETKLRPHISAIRESLAGIMGCDVSRISVKAKTNERCDATGRGEAVVAYAAVLLEN